MYHMFWVVVVGGLSPLVLTATALVAAAACAKYVMLPQLRGLDGVRPVMCNHHGYVWGSEKLLPACKPARGILRRNLRGLVTLQHRLPVAACCFTVS
jgi:hypothetical protein